MSKLVIRNIRKEIASNLSNRKLDSRLLNYSLKIIEDTIPEELLSSTFFVYSNLITSQNKNTLEIALLIDDNVLHDFTLTDNERSVTYLPLSKSTIIEFKTHYNTGSEEYIAGEDVFPYRAELYIGSDPRPMYYIAEGERNQVNSLIEFSKRLLHSIHNFT